MIQAKPEANTVALYYRTNMLSTVGLLAVFTILFLTMLFTAYYLLGLIMLGLSFAVWVPTSIYYFVQWRRYRSLKLTHLQYAVVEKAVTKAMKKNLGFQIEMKIHDEMRTLKTRPVFNETKRSQLYAPLFYRQKVRVGYDEERNEAVIIRRK